jgi:hypothetical protein
MAVSNLARFTLHGHRGFRLFQRPPTSLYSYLYSARLAPRQLGGYHRLLYTKAQKTLSEPITDRQMIDKLARELESTQRYTGYTCILLTLGFIFLVYRVSKVEYDLIMYEERDVSTGRTLVEGMNGLNRLRNLK